ncbi:MAG TPA: hypothetical protein VKQ89_00485 [Candidatus Angelobacter sp.]|nr:hypothetical protein [Candidatus Angelobacter sp.]
MKLSFSRVLAFGSLVAVAVLAMLGGRSPKAAAAVSPALSTAQAAATPAAVPKDPTKLKDWKTADEFDFDWQGKGVLSHFKIEQSQEEQVGRLTISANGQPDFVLDNDDVWDEFKNDFTPEEKFLSHYKNLGPSKYAYILSPSNAAEMRPLVFMVTPEYGSDPGTLFVLGLDSAGHPKIFLKTTLHIIEFRDLNGDGVAEIAGQPCFSQGWGHDFLTYDPFHVYQLASDPQPEYKLALELTEKYNREHYYGWAGPDCSEELAVVLHPPGGGKPVIVKSEEAKRMFTRKK